MKEKVSAEEALCVLDKKFGCPWRSGDLGPYKVRKGGYDSFSRHTEALHVPIEKGGSI